MSYFYYIILKEIKKNITLFDTLGYYAIQFVLILFSINMIMLGLYSIQSPNNDVNLQTIISIIICIVIMKTIDFLIFRRAKSLNKVAITIKNKYKQKQLKILYEEIENKLNKSRETFKWISVTMATATTISVSFTTNLYFKYSDFKNIDFIPVNEDGNFNIDLIYLINSTFIPLSFIIAGYILSFYFFLQAFNHYKRLTLVILQNSKYK